ncbi:cobalt-precorrin-5B (C(1))-methyltransferase [Thiocapsa sp.]|uniref:cobalt-precorrin-5B (C(1))-methyltransferase n=1 Tax=Thiocapsa sp. TaxID=2024551 RepID=UPI0025FB5A6A|nr:cobalt-precorrin-5B (C(1))-methyltransferase [Thiocapsa sp.]
MSGAVLDSGGKARRKRGNRTGWSTGACAAAAAAAAARGLETGAVPESIEILLPEGRRPSFAIVEGRLIGSSSQTGSGAQAVVIKDGGDDPDATHGARIVATVAQGQETVVFTTGRRTERHCMTRHTELPEADPGCAQPPDPEPASPASRKSGLAYTVTRAQPAAGRPDPFGDRHIHPPGSATRAGCRPELIASTAGWTSTAQCTSAGAGLGGLRSRSPPTVHAPTPGPQPDAFNPEPFQEIRTAKSPMLVLDLAADSPT